MVSNTDTHLVILEKLISAKREILIKKIILEKAKLLDRIIIENIETDKLKRMKQIIENVLEDRKL